MERKSKILGNLQWFAIASVVIGFAPLLWAHLTFDLDAYSLMSVSQRALVTQGQTNDILFAIMGLLGAILFMLIALYVRLAGSNHA